MLLEQDWGKIRYDIAIRRLCGRIPGGTTAATRCRKAKRRIPSVSLVSVLMNCPFPGMDPYIERCGLWDDFHPDFIGQLKRSIAPQLPPEYAVRTGERYYIDGC